MYGTQTVKLLHESLNMHTPTNYLGKKHTHPRVNGSSPNIFGKVNHFQKLGQLVFVHFPMSSFLIKRVLSKSTAAPLYPSMPLFALQIEKRYTQGILVWQPS